MKPIARIHTEFPTKFGIPRQSGLVEELQGVIVFEPEFRNADAVRGLEEYSHLWLIWEFSQARQEHWHATVRPPRLGGNTRVGVFATRSPFRPNPIGLSSVKLLRLEEKSLEGPRLYVSGADLLDGTPILDIKPYLPQWDSHPQAWEGFSGQQLYRKLQVKLLTEFPADFPEQKRKALFQILEGDPRPAYQENPNRIYRFPFAGYEISFRVEDTTAYLCEIHQWES